MKKIFTLIFAAFAMTAANAQVATVDFEGAYWNALIDNPQYNGALIYSADEYKWTDANTTLSSFCDKADWSAWGYGYGWNLGIAISNYVDAEATSYDKQLSVPVSNGSTNFAVVWENKSSFTFADGKAHVIKSMDVINTSYALANIKKSYGAGYFFTVTATGTKADGTTATVDIKLAEGETAIESWTTIDLSSLGAVTKVEFSFDGSDKSAYGVSTPKYFALDNVKVDMTDSDYDLVDFEAESWNALIDNPQYNGALIYSADEYKWSDANTTLSSFCDKADWSAWGYGFGWNYGIAISNYIDDSADASYDKQLSVPVSNGSKNFAVVWENKSELSFADGQARTIKSMDVINTTYALGNIKKSYGAGYFFTVTATGTKADGTTATVDIKLAEGETAIDSWTTIDLSSLGAVTKVEFSFDGSDKSAYGVSTPKYFALDNIVVSKASTSAIKAVKASSDATPVAYYGVNGKRYNAPQKGMNIIRMSDGTSRKVIIR